MAISTRRMLSPIEDNNNNEEGNSTNFLKILSGLHFQAFVSPKDILNQTKIPVVTPTYNKSCNRVQSRQKYLAHLQRFETGYVELNKVG